MNPLLWAGAGEAVAELVLALLIARGIVKGVNLMQYTKIGSYEYPLRAMLTVAGGSAIATVVAIMTLIH